MKKLAFNLLILIVVMLSTYVISFSNDSEIPSGLSMSNAHIDDSSSLNSKVDIKKIIVEPTSSENLLKIIKSNELSLIHVWGSWCPTSTLGLETIKDIIDNNPDLNIILVSIDLFSKEQVDIMKKVLAAKGIQTKSYIIKNEFAKDMNGLKDFQNLNHAFGLIKSFDREYSKVNVKIDDTNSFDMTPIPYTAIVTNNYEILYRVIPNIPNNVDAEPDLNNYFNIDPDIIKNIIK
jgi:thiol-disulfide isomerase/thioredoxin